MGLDAAPFLLPLMLQVGFGLSPLHAGLLTFSSSLGAMLVRTCSGTVLRIFGFRSLLAGNACLAAIVTAGCGLLRAETPVWVVVLVVFFSGCVRSIQYLGLNTISYADVPPPLLSKSTSIGGVAQQLARGFGIAIGAALLAVIAGPMGVSVEDFRLAFLLIALIPLASAFGFLRLSPVDGVEVSGHRRPQPRSV
jgi:MFS family permease